MVIFHSYDSYVSVYQRVNLHFPMVFLWFPMVFLWFSYSDTSRLVGVAGLAVGGSDHWSNAPWAESEIRGICYNHDE